MGKTSWERPQDDHLDAKRARLLKQRGERWKFLIGGLLMVGAIGVLLVSGTLTGARFFITVEDLLADTEYTGQNVRITGAVIGDTIDIQTVTDEFGNENTIIQFTIAHMPTRTDNLADALFIAANDPDATRLQIYVEGQPVPELLQNEAQAILTGSLGEDSVFYASSLQFKCPSRFDDAAPHLQGSESDHPGMRTSLDAS